MASCAISQKNIDDVNSPYYLFKYSVRSESTRKYYERRIVKFFNFVGFSLGISIEKRCNLFAEKGKKDNNWAVLHIIRFLQYEKDRVEKGDITAATLRNFVKERCVHASGTYESCTKLFQAYVSFCKSIGMVPLTFRSFGANLRRMRIQKSRPMIHGIRNYMYICIKLKQI
jgi:hypothetical protein